MRLKCLMIKENKCLTHCPMPSTLRKNKKKEATATLSKNPNIEDTLPEDFKLVPIDNFDTIDDDLLANLIYETDTEQRNSDKKTQTGDLNVALATTPNHQNILKPTQNINTINNVTTNNTKCSPFLPQMYFPNSNVTINYHFHK